MHDHTHTLTNRKENPTTTTTTEMPTMGTEEIKRGKKELAAGSLLLIEENSLNLV